MIPQSINEIKVVNTNFKNICGLLGAPGSGKGTQAAGLVKEFSYNPCINWGFT